MHVCMPAHNIIVLLLSSSSSSSFLQSRCQCIRTCMHDSFPQLDSPPPPPQYLLAQACFFFHHNLQSTEVPFTSLCCHDCRRLCAYRDLACVLCLLVRSFVCIYAHDYTYLLRCTAHFHWACVRVFSWSNSSPGPSSPITRNNPVALTCEPGLSDVLCTTRMHTYVDYCLELTEEVLHAVCTYIYNPIYDYYTCIRLGFSLLCVCSI